jgi:4-alpha-glucanotransferase
LTILFLKYKDKIMPLSAKKKLMATPHHGICVPLFSIRTKKSHGIGEFLDLIPLLDFCEEVGFDVLQLLPINDTNGRLSPYDAISVFALNPIHISLKNSPAPKLNSLKHIDYKKVWKSKKKILWDLFKRKKKGLLKSKKFISFVKKNSWLESYGKMMGDFDFYCFLQFICFEQMEQVKRFAEKKGILLKGDIPILLSKKSVDVKTHPNLFITHLNAGCAPDLYIPKGQNWGFPLYDWENHFAECIHWWIERLDAAKKLYHLYRLDHVFGLYRIFAIPDGKKPKDGHFVPKNKRKWVPLGEKILKKLLTASPMLPIAEDLGIVPNSIRASLQRLGVPGTKVLRWTRKGETNGRYFKKEEYPVLSMTTLSTHDTETLAMWWKKRPEEAKPFAKMLGIPYKKNLSQQDRFAILKFSHETNSLFHIHLLNEWLALFDDLVWEKLSDERINDPSFARKTNWCYRFRPSIEEMAKDKRLKQAISSIVLG